MCLQTNWVELQLDMAEANLTGTYLEQLIMCWWCPMNVYMHAGSCVTEWYCSVL